MELSTGTCRQLSTQCRSCNALSMPCRMEPEVNELILESLNINYIDESEYPSTTDIQNRCSTPFTSVSPHCQRSARVICQWFVDNIPQMSSMQTS